MAIMMTMLRLSTLILFFWLRNVTAFRNAAEISELQQINDGRNFPASRFDSADRPVNFVHWRLRQQQPQLKTDSVVSTTERPLVRVWNSIVRSVSLPVSAFALNITNPLANLFNDGAANIIETPPPVDDYEEPSQASTKRRNKKNKKRKYVADSNKYFVSKSQKRQRHTNIDGYENLQPTKYAYNQPYMPLRVNPYQPVFFYDAQSGNYYGLHRLNSPGYYNQANAFDQESVAYDDVDGDDEEVGDDEGDADVVLTNSGVLVTPDTLKKLLVNGGDNSDIASNVQSLNAIKTNVAVKPIIDTDQEAADLVAEHADEIAVVEKFDDEDNDFRSVSQADELGTYMRDDLFSRLRQRMPELNKKQTIEKQKPRQQFRYYFFRA